MKTPSAREQRLIACLLLVAVVALVWIGIVRPIRDGFDQRREERTQLLLQHQRNQQAAAALPLLRAAARTQRADTQRFLLTASSPQAAHDRLRDLVRRAAFRNKIVMKTSQSVESKPGWASLRGNGVVGLDGLARFLADVQNDQTVVLISTTSIAANAAFQTGTAAPMEVQLEISAPFDAAAVR